MIRPALPALSLACLLWLAAPSSSPGQQAVPAARGPVHGFTVPGSAGHRDGFSAAGPLYGSVGFGTSPGTVLGAGPIYYGGGHPYALGAPVYYGAGYSYGLGVSPAFHDAWTPYAAGAAPSADGAASPYGAAPGYGRRYAPPRQTTNGTGNLIDAIRSVTRARRR